ncbi:hypothetical protein; putative signal peptide (plasmid) [Acinetobacter baumannii SDF]|uniref:Uncharacterized protein n=1 Tax=Acinetobacter baumannii (strain SDF) TaxID=509170 RepID=B0VVC5_ACIBS|nr:hypothetical protein; putative signal peptide [Acinetobacter baumannii SDF]
MFFRIFTIFLLILSTNIEAKEKLITGEKIASSYKLLQSMTIPAIYENGMVLTKYANLYKMDNQCVIVSKLDNESNFGGYEDIIYFKNGIMLRSSKQSFFSIFLDDEAKIKSKEIKYGDFLNGKEVQKGLKEDFIQYRKKFNKYTLSKCS